MRKSDFQNPTPRRYLDTRRRQGEADRGGRRGGAYGAAASGRDLESPRSPEELERAFQEGLGGSEARAQPQVEDHGAVSGPADGDGQA